MPRQQSHTLFGQQTRLPGNIVSDGLELINLLSVLRGMQGVGQAQPDCFADLLPAGHAGQVLQLIHGVHGVLPDVAAVERLLRDDAVHRREQMFDFAIEQHHVAAVAKLAKNDFVMHGFRQQGVGIQVVSRLAGRNHQRLPARVRAVERDGVGVAVIAPGAGAHDFDLVFQLADIPPHG